MLKKSCNLNIHQENASATLSRSFRGNQPDSNRRSNRTGAFCCCFLAGLILVLGWELFSSNALAQEQVLPNTFQGTERSSLRPSISDAKIRKPEKIRGITAVEVGAGLDSILRGSEPRNLSDLVALQKQQTRVAEKINLVTVNLQHGSTQGSGVIITGEGYILTAAHVAGRPKQRIKIILHDGKEVEGVSMGVNRDSDAGLVRINKEERDTSVNPWPHASLGTSAELVEGQWCIATGHPGGWMKDRPAVVRVGRLLRIHRGTLVTDCSLIGGDSGGPLFDLEGKLIGIHSRIGVDVDENMHVAVDVYDESWERLVRNEAWGTLPGFKPAIGVIGTNDSENNNCKIARVVPRGPADIAGVRSGDVFLKFDGQPTKTFSDLIKAVEAMTPSEQVKVELLRDGKVLSLDIVVGVKD